ncbi:three-Cys-motif partner protein TcmP [Frankia sp. R82]|nr:three-Cys-motif partner protein TcmP [Frankia sp. R82]
MLSDYLPAFMKACATARNTVYLDLFAGQAENVGRDSDQRIEGSLLRALATDPPFTVVRGFELRAGRAASLQAALRARHPDRDVVIHTGDVHDTLRPALQGLDAYRRSPTFAFIDPDGVEARWELLETLAAHKRQSPTKVELFLLLPSAQIGRVVNDQLDPVQRARAERLITDLFGSSAWRPILAGRRAGDLDPETARDEFTNLMRWRLETALGYRFTHTLRMTNRGNSPMYDMIFATDHRAGDDIMKAVYSATAQRFPLMRQEARARQQDRTDDATGQSSLFTSVEIARNTPPHGIRLYQYTPPVSPYELP